MMRTNWLGKQERSEMGRVLRWIGTICAVAFLLFVAKSAFSQVDLLPNIEVANSCPAEITAGQQASYTVDVGNVGTATVANVVVTDVLPTGVSFLSSTPAPDDVTGQALTYNLGDLANGTSLQIVIEVQVDATSGTATNTASATTESTEGGGGTSNNDDSCGSTVLPGSIEPVVDGFLQDPVTGVVEPGYVVEGITYTQDTLTGEFAGYLFSAEGTNEFFFGFAQSVFINDNTYGVNHIGWGDADGHTLGKLTGSDRAEVKLFDCDGNLVMHFRMDYASEVDGTVRSLGVTDGDGDVFVGDPAAVTVESALGWNFNTVSPLWPDRFDTNPMRLPTNTYDFGTAADPSYPWIYEIAYEWSVSKSVFPGECFGGLQILEVHNSPLKEGATNPEPEPVLTVSKVADPPSGSLVSDGDIILYTIHYENTGPVVITDVVITDMVDPNLTDVVPLDGGVYDEPTRTITWLPIPVILPGESGFVRYQATVDPIEAEATIFNFAILSSPDLTQDLQTNTTQHDVIPTPDVAVVKTCPSGMVADGQASYVIQVTNEGFATATGVTLVDELPPEVSFVSSTPAPDDVSGQTLTYNLGDMLPGESIEVTVVVDVVAVQGTAVNFVQVSAAEEGDLTNNTDSCSSGIIAADIEVLKSCPAEMVNGEQAFYRFDVSNVGTATANNVVATDVLPDGVSFVSSNPAPDDVTGQTLTYNLGDLSEGSSVQIVIQVDVEATGDTLTNTASATTDSFEGGAGTSNNSDSCNSAVLLPDIVVAKTCPVDVVAGEQASYTVDVSNAGTSTADNVVVTDTLPDGVSFVGSTPAPDDVTGQTLTYNLGDLSEGASVQIVIQVSVDATDDPLINTASATTDSLEGGAGTSNNSDSCSSDVLSPDVVVSKTCPVDMVAGEQASYTVDVSNAGTTTATDVVVADVLPDGVSFVSSTPAPDDVSGQTLTYNLGDLAEGASVQIVIQVSVDATEGTLVNTASATTGSLEGGAGTSNNSDSCSSDVLSPDVVVSKACPVDLVAGEQTSYTVDVSNAGTTTAIDVVLTDVLPDGVSFVGSTPAPDDVSGQTLTYNLSDLASGAAVQIVIQVNVDATEGTIINTASATTDSVEGGAGTSNNSDSCNSDVLSPDIVVAKTCPVNMVAGEQASYTVDVGNVGTTTAINLVVTDVLPEGVSFVSSTPAPDNVTGQTLTYNLGDLADGASVQIVIQVNVDATEGTLTNTVSATTDSLEGGSGTSNNSDSCNSDMLAADVTLIKICEPSTVVANSTYDFVVDFVNQGTAAANGVTLVDLVPDGFFEDNVFSTSVTIGTISVSGLQVTVDIGTLPPGASGSLTISGQVAASTGAAGSYTNFASISSDSVQLDVSNDTGQCNVALLAPNLVLTKDSQVIELTTTVLNTATASADEIVETQTAETTDEVVRGSRLVYTMVVTNTGNADATGVVLVDMLPSGVFIVDNPDGGVVTGTTVTWSISVVPAGGSRNVTLTVETMSL